MYALTQPSRNGSTRGRQLVLLTTLMLIAAACSGTPAVASPSAQTPAASTPLSSPTTATTPSAGPTAATTAERDIAAPCIAGGPTVAGDSIFWTACEAFTPGQGGTIGTRGPAQILEYQIASANKRIVHTSTATSGVISLVRASNSWIMWVEYTDALRATDTKVYAQARGGADPILLDDAQRYGPLANLMEIALDGADAYWTQPLIENGVWHGRLMHRALPGGATEVAFAAPTGSVITWPSVRDGAIAYERSSQTAQPQTRVVLRSRDGTEREIGASPSSEPSLGDGFVAFKQSERFAQGELRAFLLGNGALMTLGPGEAPQTFGGFVVWQSSAPTDSVFRLAAPLTGCVNRLGDLAVPVGFPSVGQSVLAWTHADPSSPGPNGIRIRYASLQAIAATPCI